MRKLADWFDDEPGTVGAEGIAASHHLRSWAAEIESRSLTASFIDSLPEETVLREGIDWDDSRGLNMTGYGTLLRWIAITGCAGDWAMYCLRDDAGVDSHKIAAEGAKVPKALALRVLPCHPSAADRYRA